MTKTPDNTKECCEKCQGNGRHNENLLPQYCIDCPCHSPTKQGWEESWQVIKDGRSNSKYHKNYVAIHVAEAFIASEIQKAQVKVLDEVSLAFKIWDERSDFQQFMTGYLKDFRTRITNNQSEI